MSKKNRNTPRPTTALPAEISLTDERRAEVACMIAAVRAGTAEALRQVHKRLEGSVAKLDMLQAYVDGGDAPDLAVQMTVGMTNDGCPRHNEDSAEPFTCDECRDRNLYGLAAKELDSFCSSVEVVFAAAGNPIAMRVDFGALADTLDTDLGDLFDTVAVGNAMCAAWEAREAEQGCTGGEPRRSAT